MHSKFNDESKQRFLYHVIRTPGEGLGFVAREDAVGYAMRKHQQTADDYTVARGVFDICEGHHLPHKSMLAYYLVLCARSPEGSVAFVSRAEAEKDALTKCKRTGDVYQILYTSEAIHPNVLFLASAKRVDGKAALECAPEVALPTTVLPTA